MQASCTRTLGSAPCSRPDPESKLSRPELHRDKLRAVFWQRAESHAAAAGAAAAASQFVVAPATRQGTGSITAESRGSSRPGSSISPESRSDSKTREVLAGSRGSSKTGGSSCNTRMAGGHYCWLPDCSSELVPVWLKPRAVACTACVITHTHVDRGKRMCARLTAPRE